MAKKGARVVWALGLRLIVLCREGGDIVAKKSARIVWALD